MQTKIQKWGNSLGLWIPRSYAAEAQVKEGSSRICGSRTVVSWCARSEVGSMPVGKVLALVDPDPAR